MNYKNGSFISHKRLLLIIGGLLFFFFIYQQGLIGDRDFFNELSLRRRYNQLLKLKNDKDFGKIYDTFLLPDLKEKISREKFTETASRIYKKDYETSPEIEILTVTLKNPYGFIERTRKICLNGSCNESQKQMIYRKWIFINGKWYADGETPCIRESPFYIPPEFERAISLIIQRTKESNYSSWRDWSKTVEESRNCLDIQYATSDEQMVGTEGFFSFSPEGNVNRYQILVSPRYRVKDDLITAFLLVHELSHVINYQGLLSSGKSLSCYEDEANAFNNQNAFADLLNSEELQSLNTRSYYGPSLELNQLVYIYNEIPKYEGATYEEKARNYVENDPFYQEQCKGR